MNSFTAEPSDNFYRINPPPPSDYQNLVKKVAELEGRLQKLESLMIYRNDTTIRTSL